MNQSLFRLLAVICLLGVSSLCFQRLACGTRLTDEQGPHLLPAAVGEYLDGVAQSSDLQAQVDSNHRRLQAKYAIVMELLARRLTLLEAAARFGDLDADVPGLRVRLSQHYPGASYEVALCRQVIAHARSVLQVHAPEQAERVVAHLEAELQAHLECEAGLRLP
jgi:hypothetical protein